MASDQHVNLFFESKALASDTFGVIRFEGEEAISQPFRFEIELVSDQPDIDLDAVLGRPATLSWQRGDEGTLRKIHGVLAEFEQGGEGTYEQYIYRAVLVPRVWMLTMTRQNQIYQAKTVPEIIEEELKGSKNKGPASESVFPLTTDDFELRLNRNYPVREYVVQYQESDLNFISRLMEHEGIFYFFEHDDEKDKLVICDGNTGFPPLPDACKAPYRSASGMATGQEESVLSFVCRHSQIPAKVILTDYNYRKPETTLKSERDIEDDGYGVISEYGDHYKTPDEGDDLAKIRAEEIHCRKRMYFGNGDCLALSAGHPLELEEHFRNDFNREYVLIRVRHEAAQASAGLSGLDGGDGESASYRNDFVGIPSDIPFRPERTTPKPKLTGIMNAKVDGASDGEYAEIDQEGRYKVSLPFDLSDNGDGKASRYIRMAQPYGGDIEGMHFPLHKGTEVIWTCVDGDPDRPIITGAVPNPLTRSVVNHGNQTRSVIRSAAQNHILLDDAQGKEGIRLYSPAGETYFRMGQPPAEEKMDSITAANGGGGAQAPIFPDDKEEDFTGGTDKVFAVEAQNGVVLSSQGKHTYFSEDVIEVLAKGGNPLKGGSHRLWTTWGADTVAFPGIVGLAGDSGGLITNQLALQIMAGVFKAMGPAISLYFGGSSGRVAAATMAAITTVLPGIRNYAPLGGIQSVGGTIMSTALTRQGLFALHDSTFASYWGDVTLRSKKGHARLRAGKNVGVEAETGGVKIYAGDRIDDYREKGWLKSLEKTWKGIELSTDKSIIALARRDIALHALESMNIHSDKDMTFTSGGNIYFSAGNGKAKLVLTKTGKVQIFAPDIQFNPPSPPPVPPRPKKKRRPAPRRR